MAAAALSLFSGLMWTHGRCLLLLHLATHLYAVGFRRYGRNIYARSLDQFKDWTTDDPVGTDLGDVEMQRAGITSKQCDCCVKIEGL